MATCASCSSLASSSSLLAVAVRSVGSSVGTTTGACSVSVGAELSLASSSAIFASALLARSSAVLARAVTLPIRFWIFSCVFGSSLERTGSSSVSGCSSGCSSPSVLSPSSATSVGLSVDCSTSLSSSIVSAGFASLAASVLTAAAFAMAFSTSCAAYCDWLTFPSMPASDCSVVAGKGSTVTSFSIGFSA